MTLTMTMKSPSLCAALALFASIQGLAHGDDHAAPRHVPGHWAGRVGRGAVA